MLSSDDQSADITVETRPPQEPTRELPRDLPGALPELRAVVLLTQFVFNSCRRNARLYLSTMAVMIALALVALMVLPRSYRVSARILTGRSYIIHSLVQPRRSIPIQADNPTRGAREILSSREFRSRLIESADLRRRWDEQRSWIGRIKDGLRNLVLGEPNEADMREALLKLLERRVWPKVDGSVVGITVGWGDPELAFELTRASVDLFLSLQRETELNQISDTIDILERNIDKSTQRLNESADRLQALIEEKSASMRKRTASQRRVMSFRRAAPSRPATSSKDPDVARLSSRLRDVQYELRKLTADHDQRVARAEESLGRLTEGLGPNHPDVREAKRQVELTSAPPSELVRLIEQETALRDQIAQSTGVSDKGASAAANRFSVVQVAMSDEAYGVLSADPEVDSLMEELRKRVHDHNDFLDRLDDAQLEIETSEAAFNYRYVVVQPPLRPTKPVSPKPALVLGAGVIAGLFLVFLLMIIIDILPGRVHEAWQLERALGVRVLAELRRR